MTLTVSELALAVGKNENYVRQHIHRRHLVVRRRGRSVSIPLEEAVRWAGTRGLPFVAPKRITLTALDPGERIGRLTVLAWNFQGGRTRNLFTFMRHRKRAALGPWSGAHDATWRSEELPDGLRLLSLNASYERCREQLDAVTESGRLEAAGQQIHFVLEDEPRNHWAYRDHRRGSKASIPSPFSMHSAAITEYWSFEKELHRAWLSLSAPLPERLRAAIGRLGLPLDRFPERVGNVLVAAAEDAITCRLTAHSDQTLRLHVEARGLLPETYRATVWASHSGDEVLRKEVPVTAGQTTIALASEVDRTGFAICRDFDGQFVDLVDNLPGIEPDPEGWRGDRLPGRGRDPLRSALLPGVQPTRQATRGSGPSEASGRQLDRNIRQQWLHRVANEREASARRGAHLVRFGSGRFDDAARQFLSFITNDARHAEPVYLADPCFGGDFSEVGFAKLFADLCAAINQQPLRVLSAARRPPDGPPWWAHDLGKSRADVRVRSFVNRTSERRCLHDRYLITPAREILMTNSLHRWGRLGVTFVSLPYGTYRAEAERLWGLEPDTPTADVIVREFL